jgi:hypothetical protein
MLKTEIVKNIFTLLIILPALYSCREQSSTNKAAADSITMVSINYYPAFTHSSVITINRGQDSADFLVDTSMFRFSYGAPKPMKVSLKDLRSQTMIDSFWNADFIKTLRPSKNLLTDGMSVEVYYTNNGRTDSISLGNNYPKRVNNILLEQVKFLERQAKDTAMKMYLKDLREYLVE